MQAAALTMHLIATDGEPAVLTVAGDVDLATADQLRTRLVDTTGDGRHPRLVVDLSGVAFCDASGLSAFLAGWRQARQHGGWLRLCGMQPAVGKVFRITGMDQVLGSYPSRDEAVNGGEGRTTGTGLE